MVTSRFGQSVAVMRAAARRRDVGLVVFGSGLVYALVYLSAVGHLTIQPGIGFEVMVVQDPLARMFESGPGRFSYEPIAMIDLWLARYQFSPLNTIIGIVLAGLVGLNLGLSYLAVVQPRACGLGTGSGVLAAIPALLAGGACCAPVILLVLGITAGGMLLTVISWLLPVGVVLLVGSLVYLALQIDPTIVPS